MTQSNDTSSTSREHPFDEKYFKSGPYAQVSFKKYSQYWWSNRFYATLARKHGPTHGKVLEIGCGLGHLLTWLTDQYKVFGSDINEWALEQARQNVPGGEFFLQSAEDLKEFPDGHFQVVIAKHVVEHLPNPERAIQEMSRVLSEGGLLILATPNLDSPMRQRKQDQWIGYQDPTHISLKSPAEWLGLLRQNRLQPRKVFSDGFWDAPYLAVLPTQLQKLVFGLPGGLQAILGWSIIPLSMGESLIALADKV
jgi:ubiquinone/menaquinone biosynthesis C-methylase UbiE